MCRIVRGMRLGLMLREIRELFWKIFVSNDSLLEWRFEYLIIHETFFVNIVFVTILI